jgi:hypothetical protein
MMRKSVVRAFVVTLAFLGIVGCKSSEPAQPATRSKVDIGSSVGSSVGSNSGSANAKPGGGDASMSPQARLMSVLRDYQLPAQSVPAGRHADAQVDGVIQKMMSVASQQGLTFDGSRAAAEGIVVVGRPGKSGKPMLVAVAVYPKSGRVAMQDASTANGLDYRDAEQMKQRYLNAL